jgi:hypothetical protein
MQQPIEIQVVVRMSQQPYGAGQINLEETFQVGPTDFIGLAGIMGRFHDLAQELRALYAPNAKK